MLSFILMLSAYTASITTIIYLTAYSRLYSWWRSPLGRVMNLSLVSLILIAIGGPLRFFDNLTLGSIIGIVGWVSITVLLILRLGILTSTARIRRKELKDKFEEDYRLD